MNSLLHVLLLLLALHAPQAPGQPLRMQSTQSTENYSNIIKEIMGILNNSTVFPEPTLDLNEEQILKNNDLLSPNLDAFMNAANNFEYKGKSIKANLEKFKKLLPTPKTTEEPIGFNGWHDFRKKMTTFLNHLMHSTNLF